MNNLRITTTDAKIGIQSTSGYYDIRQPKGEQSIKTTNPVMNITGEPVRVIIDSYECWAERGFKNNIDLLSENAQLAKRVAMAGLARAVSDGNRMMDIRKSMPPAIPEIAEKNSRPIKHEFNFGLIPKSKPKIDIVGGQSIEWQIGKTEIDYQVRKPEINYNMGKVETYMRQYQDINYEFIDKRSYLNTRG